MLLSDDRDHGERRKPRGVMPVLLAANVVRVPGDKSRCEDCDEEPAPPDRGLRCNTGLSGSDGRRGRLDTAMVRRIKED